MKKFMDTPQWFPKVKWTVHITVEAASSKRAVVPQNPGVYCFTNYPEILEKNTGVLYVGMASKSIQKRLSSYLVDPAEMLLLGRKGGLSSSLRHPGKVQLLTKIQQRGAGVPSGIWIRWHECAGAKAMETQLIRYLRPAYNSSENTDERTGPAGANRRAR